MDLELRDRLDRVFNTIEEARKSVSQHHIVKIVAVTKYSEVEAIEKLYGVGHRAFGENRVQDLALKSETLDSLPIEWHFIGNLQKNKINKLLSLQPSLFQGLDSLKIADELQKRLVERGQKLNALLQINSSYEDSKAGVKPEEAEEIYHRIREEMPNINLKGVMTIGSHTTDEVEIGKSFERTRRIYETLPEASVLSMGMSGDYSIAIREGSNMVRLGSILFK
jgi:pyridoxal phosphate enzyme (YggS family)